MTQNLYFATFATRHHDPWPKSCDVQQPRNSPEAELIEGLKANAFFGPVKAISISQIPSEYGIDVYVPNSATDGPHKHGMAWITVCRGITRMARQSIQVHRQHEIPDDREVPHCPLREPRHDGQRPFHTKNTEWRATVSRSQSVFPQREGSRGFCNEKERW